MTMTMISLLIVVMGVGGLFNAMIMRPTMPLFFKWMEAVGMVVILLVKTRVRSRVMAVPLKMPLLLNDLVVMRMGPAEVVRVGIAGMAVTMCDMRGLALQEALFLPMPFVVRMKV
jgi:hypothetical protein